VLSWQKGMRDLLKSWGCCMGLSIVASGADGFAPPAA
jgi:hypothetical protein